MSMHHGNFNPIKVTISDAVTGEVLEEKTLANDYAIITAGSRYVKSIQIMGRTHMLAVAVDKSTSTRANDGQKGK